MTYDASVPANAAAAAELFIFTQLPPQVHITWWQYLAYGEQLTKELKSSPLTLWGGHLNAEQPLNSRLAVVLSLANGNSKTKPTSSYCTASGG